jgi:DNA-binding CsgD family transcriptional regulator/PAS domain-containing protein
MLMEKEYQLIGDIYDAMYDNNLLTGVMVSIRELTGADSAGFAAIDFLNPDYSLLLHSGFSEAMLSELIEGGYGLQQIQFMGHQWMGKLDVGTPSSSNHFWSDLSQYQAAGGSYVQFINRHNFYHQAPIVFERSESRWVGLGLNNGLSKPFNDTHLEFLRRTSTHFQRSLQIHRQLVEVRQQNAVIYRLLNAMQTGVILLGNDGRIRFCNHCAETFLCSNNSLKIRLDYLHAADLEQDKRLDTFIRGAIETSQRDCQGNTGGVLGLVRAGHTTPLMLSITPLSQLPDYQELRSDHIAAAIFISDPDNGCQISSRLLAQNYQLTAREIEICEGFVNLPVLEALAIRVGLTINSLRSHMKVIYEKTGKHSQAELMRLLMGLRINFEHIR